MNISLIFDILTSNSNKFIKDVLTTIIGKIKNNSGYKVDNSDGNFFLIFIIGVKAISIRKGDVIIPYFTYETKIDNKSEIKNIIIKNPYLNYDKENFENKNINEDNTYKNINKIEIRILKLNAIKIDSKNSFKIL